MHILTFILSSLLAAWLAQATVPKRSKDLHQVAFHALHVHVGVDGNREADESLHRNPSRSEAPRQNDDEDQEEDDDEDRDENEGEGEDEDQDDDEDQDGDEDWDEDQNSGGYSPLQEGLGPLPNQDTPDAFREFGALQDMSVNAVIPDGYDLVIENVDGSIESTLGFLGVKFLRHYDTAECASMCNDRPNCDAFNTYFERDPLYDPSFEDGCPDPPSTNIIKCVLWSSPLTENAAINYGEIRAGFEVVITGSNLYNKQDGVLKVPDFNGPFDVDNHAAFDVPLEPVGGYDTHISHDVFDYDGSVKVYDASLCASICEEWTDRNSATLGSANGPFFDDAFAVCSMFVAYELRSNNKPVAMVCDTFSSVWSHHYQSIRGVDDMEVTKVSVYSRKDYQYQAICAIEEHCSDDEYYIGGDCSGWGPGKCQEEPQEASPKDASEREQQNGQDESREHKQEHQLGDEL